MLKTMFLAVAAVLVLGAAALAEDLLVGTFPDFPPFEYTDLNDTILGFDIDLVNGIGRHAGFTPRFIEEDFAALVEGLIADRFDMIASGLTITEARRERIDFSEPYFGVSLVAVVREGDGAIAGAAQLAEARIAVLMGTTSAAFVEDAAGPSATVREFLRYDEVFDELATGRVDVVVVDGPMARSYAQRMGGMTVGDVSLHSEEYGLAVRKGNVRLIERINAGLAAMRESGEYEALRRKWFPE